VGGVVKAGSVRLVDGTTGLEIGLTAGDDANDQLGFSITGVTALANNNFVIAADLDDMGVVVDAGSVRLVDGVTGIPIVGGTITGSTANDQLGSGGVTASPGKSFQNVADNGGNDPDAMYGAAKVAIDRARAGEGPTLIEALTYRFNGHLLGDDGNYMDKEERQQAIDADPVARLRTRLISDGVLTESDAEKISADITAVLDEAIEFALQSDFPTLDELRRDVFATELA